MSTVAFMANPATKYGGSLLPGAATSQGQDTQLTAVAGASPDDQTPIYSPEHPLFWLGLILAGAVGLAYFSTTVRVGPAEAAVSVGKK